MRCYRLGFEIIFVPLYSSSAFCTFFLGPKKYFRCTKYMSLVKQNSLKNSWRLSPTSPMAKLTNTSLVCAVLINMYASASFSLSKVAASFSSQSSLRSTAYLPSLLDPVNGNGHLYPTKIISNNLVIEDRYLACIF